MAAHPSISYAYHLLKRFYKAFASVARYREFHSPVTYGNSQQHTSRLVLILGTYYTE